MKAPLEKDIQKQVMDYLWLVGAVPIRVNSGAFGGEYKGKKRFIRANSEPGCSDILCCYRGRFLAFEVKRPKKNPTPKQLEFLIKIRHAAGFACAVRSINEVKQAIGLIDEAIDAGVA